MAKQIVAIMYDFDKTLSTSDMQNYSFIPNLGLTPQEFWGKTQEFSEKYGVERILSYMYVMLKLAKDKGIKMTRKYLQSCGENIEFYPGVLTWFKRINSYAEKRGIQVEHYLVSSGTREIVEGCPIYKEFKKVYGCEFFYNQSHEACWPKFVINYTQKTQFYFKISKGVSDAKDDIKVNERLGKHRVPYRNIIYLGDGMTDVACMTVVKQNGGNAIGVYKDEFKEQAKKLYDDERVSFVCKGDYSAGSQIEKVVHLIIDSIALQTEIEKKQVKLVK